MNKSFNSIFDPPRLSNKVNLYPREYDFNKRYSVNKSFYDLGKALEKRRWIEVTTKSNNIVRLNNE